MKFLLNKEFFRDVGQAVLAVRWQYMGIALFLAATLWYMVTVRDKVESWVDVRVEFKGAPSGLVIRDGLINKVAVRLRAAMGLSRSLSGRDASVALDLSGVTKGVNTLHITPKMLPFTNAFEVMEITPQRIQIIADSVDVRTVPLEATFDTTLPSDFFIRSLQFIPPSVTVRGAETLVGTLTSVKVPLALGGIGKPGASVLTVSVPAPESVSVTPAQVNVELEVGLRTKTTRLTREVLTGHAQGSGIKASPQRVTVTVEVPESYVGNAEVLSQILATVNVGTGSQPGTQKLPVTVLVPELVTLKDVSPKEVTITIPDK